MGVIQTLIPGLGQSLRKTFRPFLPHVHGRQPPCPRSRHRLQIIRQPFIHPKIPLPQVRKPQMKHLMGQDPIIMQIALGGTRSDLNINSPSIKSLPSLNASSPPRFDRYRHAMNWKLSIIFSNCLGAGPHPPQNLPTPHRGLIPLNLHMYLRLPLSNQVASVLALSPCASFTSQWPCAATGEGAPRVAHPPNAIARMHKASCRIPPI